jgi:hypothetical protein
MAENKTKATGKSVAQFLASVEPADRRKDCRTLATLMRDVTKAPARMWGASIVGFGTYHYKYDSGREGDFFLAGFAPRKTDLTVYIMAGFDRYDELMKKLGRHSTGKSCLYIKRLADVDVKVLRALVTESVRYMKKRYPGGR